MPLKFNKDNRKINRINFENKRRRVIERIVVINPHTQNIRGIYLRNWNYYFISQAKLTPS